jgi:hypothetical protein
MKKQVQPQRGTTMHKEGVEPLITVPRRDNREESRALDFTIIAGELGRGTVGL